MKLSDVIITPGTRGAQPAAASVAVGSLYYVTDESKLERSNGTTWAAFAATGGGAHALLSATHSDVTAASPVKGDIITTDGVTWKKLAVGTNGYVLTADSTAGTGNKWAATAGGGKVVQVVNTETGAVATGTTGIPDDDTIPQNTEGDQYMSLAITPTSAGNNLKIDVIVNLSANGIVWIIAALFQDSTVNALASGQIFSPVSGAGGFIAFSHFMAAGTTSATTFKVRGGRGTYAGTTTTFNGSGGARSFGGTLVSSITIAEIVP